MNKINAAISEYEPKELLEWREKMDETIQDRGRKLGVEIEKIMKKIVLYNIKALFAN